MPRRPARAWLLGLLLLAACDRGGARHTAHRPVDPSLDLAIVVPADLSRVTVGPVWIERSAVFADAESWVADARGHNLSLGFGEPHPDGDAWVVTATGNAAGVQDFTFTYRALGDGLAITCTAITAFEDPSEDDLALARAVCAGTQRVARGVYVPFRLSTTERATDLVLALVGEPLNWSVQLEPVADSPEWRFDPAGVGGKQHQIDHGTVVGGTWFLSTGPTAGGDHYDAVARRRIGEHHLACYGDGYHDETYARVQLALCLGLEVP